MLFASSTESFDVVEPLAVAVGCLDDSNRLSEKDMRQSESP